MKESILPRMKTDAQNMVLGGIIEHLNNKKMVLVLGEPGEGKTITVLDFCAQNECPSYYFRCSPNTTMNGLLIFIAKAIGVRITDNNDQMQARIQEELKRNPNFCFAFDEVEYLACGNCKKLDVIRQIFDDTDVSIIICGTYDLKDMITGEQSRSRKKNHNRSQLYRRLRLAEFELIEEREVYDYLDLLEKEYAISMDSSVKRELVSQCRDRHNGGLGNFIEIIELLLSYVRPEWEQISWQIIRSTGRMLHTHTEQIQAFTALKPRKDDPQDDKTPANNTGVSENPGIPPRINVAELSLAHIDIDLYSDAIRHKLTK